jgi:hypothetical protein
MFPITFIPVHNLTCIFLYIYAFCSHDKEVSWHIPAKISVVITQRKTHACLERHFVTVFLLGWGGGGGCKTDYPVHREEQPRRSYGSPRGRTTSGTQSLTVPPIFPAERIFSNIIVVVTNIIAVIVVAVIIIIDFVCFLVLLLSFFQLLYLNFASL